MMSSTVAYFMLTCWEDRSAYVCLDGSVFGPGYQKAANVVVEGYSLGCIFLVMTNELHLEE
jgi:hypothetical protein